MATVVTMPKLGMTMEEGTVHAWFKQEGDAVQEGEPLLSVLTDKIDIEVEAPASGVVRKILVPAGETVPINTPIAIIADADADISHLLGGPGDEERRARATPVARRLAKEYGVNLAEVRGTGPRGRVTRADVEEYVARREAQASPRVAENESPAGADRHGSAISRASQRVPLTGLRRVIAQRMSASAFSAPHVTLLTEADVTELVQLRSRLNEADRARGGPGVSYIDFFVVIAARALLQHPYMNARLEDDQIVLEPGIHIGIAVDVPGGLVVPVIRDVAELSVGAVARRRAALVAAARGGTLSPDDLHGGTFTVSNLGHYEIDGFTPIINPPQAAILGLGRVVEKPAVYQGQICVRSLMTLSLSFDHRIVDGAPAAAFLQTVKRLAEEPALLHL